MARIRTIKPEIWLSPQVMNLSHPARLLFIGLITQADDYGRGSADARRLKAEIFPGDDVTAAEVSGWLVAITEQQLAMTYDGGPHGSLYAIPTWSEHQYIQKRAKESRYPDPYRNATGTLPASDGSPTVGSTRARIGSEGSEGTEGSDLTRARPREALLGGPRRAPAIDEWIAEATAKEAKP